jgi:MATE family multidrug resistance protein
MQEMTTLEYGREEASQRPLVELLRLAGPTIAQMASYTVMQFLDTWMLARANGIGAPTAAANSGILAFAVISLGMGVLWVVNTLVSQAFGRKDYPRCGQYLWQGIWFAVAYSLLLLPFLPSVPGAFRMLGHDADMVRQESLYLQIVVTFSAVKLVGTAFGQFLLAIDRAWCVMVATIAGVGVNAIAAWILVFGKFGVHPTGVVGAAWAQNIGVGVETLVAIVFALEPSVRRKFNSLDWRFRWEQMKTLLRVGLPSGAQVVADVLAWGAFMNLVMAFFGVAGMAANNFVFRYMSVSFMPAFGISTAVTALVGRYIGRKQPEVAVQRAHLGFKVAATYMLICAVFFVIWRNQLIGLFSNDPEVRRLGATLLVFAAVYQLFDAMYIVYFGGLRGAGDTFVPAVATAVLCWSMTVLGGYFVARHAPQLGPAGPWYVATAYGGILGVFMLVRFTRGGWRAIHLDQPSQADTVPNPNLNVAIES